VNRLDALPHSCEHAGIRFKCPEKYRGSRQTHGGAEILVEILARIGLPVDIEIIRDEEIRLHEIGIFSLFIKGKVICLLHLKLVVVMYFYGFLDHIVKSGAGAGSAILRCVVRFPCSECIPA